MKLENFGEELTGPKSFVTLSLLTLSLAAGIMACTRVVIIKFHLNVGASGKNYSLIMYTVWIVVG